MPAFRARAASPRDATFIGADGKTIAKREARFFRFDHLPGGFVFVPDDGIAAKTVRLAEQ